MWRLAPPLLIVILAMSCAIETHHSGQVNQVVTIDTATMNAYYEVVCKEEMPSALQEELDACAVSKTAHFLNFIQSLGDK